MNYILAKIKGLFKKQPSNSSEIAKLRLEYDRLLERRDAIIFNLIRVYNREEQKELENINERLRVLLKYINSWGR